MNNQKTTKRSLVAAGLVLLLCIAMLVGTTFAWFTDSVTSNGNIIKSGTLDVALEWADGKTAPGNTTWTDASQNAIFNYDKWEPGYVEVRHIKISNNGTLALKYKVNIVANGEVSNLAEVIDVYYIDPAEKIENRTALEGKTPMGNLTDALAGMSDTANGRLEADQDVIITIALKMRESAGNEYQDKSIGTDFSVQLVATQDTVEYDSYNNTYDADAKYPVVASTQAELNDAINSAQNGSAISTKVVLPAGDFKLENGTAQDKNITISGTADTVVTVVGDTGNQMNYQNGATLAFEGVTIQGQTAGNFGGIAHVAKTTFVNCTFNGKLTLYGDATFINCTFINSNDYAIWTWGAKNAEFIGCTFNSGGKALLLYGGAGSTETPTTNLTVTDCEFNDDNTLTTADKAAIEIGNDYGAVYNLTVKNSTANGFTVNPAGISTGSNIWANKNSMDQTHLNVVIDGVDVY